MNKSRKILGAAALLALLAPVALAVATVTRGKTADMPATGSAAVFSSALTVAGGRPSTSTDPGRGVWWNITVTLKSNAAASKVYLRRIVDGDTSHDDVLNADATLTPGLPYGTSVQVHPDYTYNIVLGTTTHLAALQIEEEP